MLANERIELRRKELGLRDIELASSVGLSIHEYRDVEWYPDEIFTSVDLRAIRRICEVLEFDFMELLNMRCVFCQKGRSFQKDYLFPRNRLIQQKRIELGLTPDEFGRRTGFEVTAVIEMENDPDYLERMPVYAIGDLARVIKVPLQVLLNVKCRKCCK